MMERAVEPGPLVISVPLSVYHYQKEYVKKKGGRSMAYGKASFALMPLGVLEPSIE